MLPGGRQMALTLACRPSMCTLPLPSNDISKPLAVYHCRSAVRNAPRPSVRHQATLKMGKAREIVALKCCAKLTTPLGLHHSVYTCFARRASMLLSSYIET